MSKDTIHVFNNLSIKGLVANGYVGSAGQALLSNGSGAYWGSGAGFTGSKGDIGFTGSKGDVGFTGSQGIIGYTGSQGDIGFTGSKGDIGFTGSASTVVGYTGSQGNIGFTGSASTVIGYTGSKGDIGFTGSKGDIGFTGSASTVVGYTGSQGPIGYTGSQGAIGYTGSQGAIGYTGSAGPAALPQNPTGTTYGDGVSETPTYMLSQTVGDNDGWRLYGESPVTNQVRMVFELNDDIEEALTDQWVFRNKKTYSGYNARSEFNISGTGDSYSRTSSRAPIFYDSNDTAYYIDPASTSVLTTIYARKSGANNTPAIQIRGGNFGYPRFQTYGLDADANAWMGLGTDMGGGSYEHSVYFPNGTAGNGRLSIGDYNGTTYNPRLWVYTNYTQINNSTRSPLFYDSDNTSYYVNPNGTSYIEALNIGPTASGASYLNINGYNAYGGTGYHGFLTIYNTYSSATNPYQYWRLNGAGGWEIINSAYNAVLFTFTQGGDFTAAGNVTAYSDRKLKANFNPIKNALSKVLQLNGVTFTRIDKEDTTKRYAGLLAQDVETALPEAVQSNETMSYGEVKSVDYNGTIALLVEAIKEQQAHINSLEDKINLL
jgi:hypothetical protein